MKIFFQNNHEAQLMLLNVKSNNENIVLVDELQQSKHSLSAMAT